MSIPQEPVILLSYINTQLRDFYPSLKELARSLDASEQEIKDKLAPINYTYDESKNRFV